MKSSDRFWIKEVLTAIPIVLTLSVAGYVIYRNKVQPFAVTDLLGWIVLILGLLAGGELVQRYATLASIDRRMSILASSSERLTAGHLGDLFLKNRDEFPPFVDRIKNAREIWLLSISINALVEYNFGAFIEKAREGVSIRFLLMNPDVKLVEVRSRGLYSSTPTSLKNDIARSIERITKITQETGAKVECKLTDFVSSHGMVLVDPHKNDGSMIVEIYPYNVTARDRAHFELTRKDARWYGFFLSQYEALWRDAKEVSHAPST
jgi:hypothetical protein